MSETGSRPDRDIIQDLVETKRKEFEGQLLRHNIATDKRLRDLDLDDTTKPEIDPEFLELPESCDVGALSNNQIGQRHFGGGVWLAYVQSQCALEDIRRTIAKEAREGAYSEALLGVDGGTADHRRAVAFRDPSYRAWNSVYLLHLTMFRRLSALCDRWKERVALYSREISLRVSLAETETNRFA